MKQPAHITVSHEVHQKFKVAVVTTLPKRSMQSCAEEALTKWASRKRRAK